jgi:hypothetical protein
MAKANESHAFLTKVAGEHRDLERRLNDLRDVVRGAEAEPAIGQALLTAIELLTALREQMRLHFAEEVAGGAIEEAVGRLPRLAGQAAAIEREHPELLLRVNQTLELARQGATSIEQWKQVRSSIEAFASQMLAHEAIENQLLQVGFNEDQ